MTAITATSVDDRNRQHHPPLTFAGRKSPGRVTLGRVVQAEFIKLRTARSMVAAGATAGLLAVGVGAFSAVGLVVQDATATGPDAATPDPLGGALTGVSPATYAIATLGVLAVTSEYASGSIKSTLAGVPRRAQLVLGKALAVAATTFTVMLTAVLAAFVAAQAIVAIDGIDLSLTADGVIRAIVGSALYLTGVAIIGTGLGWLLRSTAGAVATFLGVFVILPVIGFVLPEPVAGAILPYLPSNAGAAIMQLTPGDGLSPWAGLAAFALYAALTLFGAAFALQRRDA
jgi:ABC-type transport system involved in multi-copper enzyme maturation permease subunit